MSGPLGARSPGTSGEGHQGSVGFSRREALPTRDNESKNRTIGVLAPISAPTGVILSASRPNSSRYARFFR